MNSISNKSLPHVISLLSLFIIDVYSQETHSYNIDAKLDIEKNIIEVVQSVKFKNISNENISEIYFEDWANSYINNESNLASRITDEYDRSFSFASKNRRGYTNLNEIQINSTNLDWSRLINSNDIIKISLNKEIKPNESELINLKYSVKIPDKKFTGYGYGNNSDYYLKNWIISIAGISNDIWIKQSNLNLDDQSLQKSNYLINLEIPLTYNSVSNLNNIDENGVNNNSKIITYSGSNISDVEFIIQKKNTFKNFTNSNFNIVTDIFTESDEKDIDTKVKRILDFIEQYFPKSDINNLLVPKSDYDKNPFYGLNELPNFLSPFSKGFLEEITFLKSFIDNYINEEININRRKNHFIYNGLSIFLVSKYIDKYHSRVRYLGRLSGFKILKNYELSNIPFNDLFIHYYESIQRLNLHQSDLQSGETLTKANYNISSPYHTGIGLLYLESYIGEDNFKKVIDKLRDLSLKSDNIERVLKTSTDKNIDWFIDEYLSKRESLDLKIDVLNQSNEITYKVSEKNNKSIPYNISLIKNDSIVFSKWNDNYILDKIPNLNADYIAINPIIELPEINKSNNWYYLKNNGSKPIKLLFLGDIGNPKYKKIFLRPEFTYNYYDGVSPGLNIFNTGIKYKAFNFEILPQFSTKENTLVGSSKITYNLQNENKNNYSTIFNLFYITNHYKEDLRYQVFSPSISMFFRDNNNLRSNVKKLLSLSMFSVDKDVYEKKANLLDNYTVYDLGYTYSDIGISKYLKTSANTRLSDNFGKINIVFDYRKLFKNNRQFQFRFYLGKFLWNNESYDNFRNDLGRSDGYLLLTDYLGRSERTGLLSQQFVMAGGGFKSIFENPKSDDLMIATNINIGIWKWFEGYLDLGILKDKNQKKREFYGTGIKLNLLPDFFELYFPISSSNGLEIDDYRYYNKIRFVLSYEVDSLINLFSRKWF
tara:strand:+ start:4594 stop:7404 length:2811 start_codon:yes stop_codon:yes gene_type:complete